MASPKKSPRSTSGRITAKKPMRVEKLICMDPEAAGRVIELRRRRDELTSRVRVDQSLQPDLDGLLADLADAEDEARANSVKFVAIALGKSAWSELKAKYPPTKEQKRDAQRDGISLPFDHEAFPPVAFRECLRIAEEDENGHETLVPLTAEDIEAIFEGDDWNESEVGELFTAIIYANGTMSSIGDLGNG